MAGSDAPLAAQATAYTSSRRIAGGLDAASAPLIPWQRSAFDHQRILRSLLAVQACYRRPESMYIALDHWPVHDQAEVLTTLQSSKITLVFLPTSAPWKSPIEKLGRTLRQELLHLHRYSSHWQDWPERLEV